MRYPMPSPAGTNHERLFLPADFCRRSAGAYDEYKPLPHMTGDGDLLEEFRAWLSAKLNAEDAAKLDEYLARLTGTSKFESAGSGRRDVKVGRTNST